MRFPPRIVCKVCDELYEPMTYRERVTGTCDKEPCWRPFSDTEGVKIVEEDLYEYKFKCLRCSEMILTNTASERLCKKCRRRNQRQ